MTDEKQQYLYDKYPQIFGKVDEQTSPMSYGIGVGDGWFQLVLEICELLEQVRQRTGIVYRADQIKEKFGGLRFYCSDDRRLLPMTPDRRAKWNKLVSEFIMKKSFQSESICESCGGDGTMTSGGWKKCLCERCNEDRYKRKL